MMQKNLLSVKKLRPVNEGNPIRRPGFKTQTVSGKMLRDLFFILLILFRTPNTSSTNEQLTS